MSALRWASREKAKSRGAMFSCLAHTWFDMLSRVSVRASEYVPTAFMGAADDLSRNRLDNPVLEGSTVFNLQELRWVDQLFSLCDPAVGEDTTDFHGAFQSIHSILVAHILTHK